MSGPKYNFVRFEGVIRNRGWDKSPERMAVGEVIERKKPSASCRYNLARQMRDATAKGMVFSFAVDGDVLAIRRDK